MYTTCLFCHADLGRNEALEAFPVGRRLAYDQARGRLWVVCRRCERWNLTPQEERWEAMEQAERWYRGTRLRASTDNVGLARLRDGTELVRVGRPLRPEFAAWRYGDQFGRRRRMQLAAGGLAVAVGGGALAWGLAAGIGGVVLYQIGSVAWRMVRHGIGTTTVGRLPGPNEGLLVVKRGYLGQSYFTTGTDGHPALSLLHSRGRVLLEGAAALAATARLMPATNRFAGSAPDVRTAVGRLDRAGSPEALLTHAAGVARAIAAGQSGQRSRLRPTEASHTGEGRWYETGLFALDPTLRLALEMAAHEEQERRALEGELRELEAAWRQAEEIAAIADDLLVPHDVGARLDQLRASTGRSSARAGAPSSPTTDSGAASSS